MPLSNNLKIIITPVNPDHGGLDEIVLKNHQICKIKKKVKALINVFYAGQVWDVHKFTKFAKKKILKLLMMFVMPLV